MATGYLTKVGFKSGKWQRRFCTFIGGVFTYASGPDSHSKSVVNIDTHTVVQTVPEGTPALRGLAAGVDAKPCGAHSFKIATPWKNGTRTFYFTADSEPERDRWVAAIIAELQTKFPPPKNSHVLDGSLAEERPLARVPLFLEIVSAKGLPPRADASAPSASVRVSVIDDSGEDKTGLLCGPARPGTTEPIWRAFFSTGLLATSTHLLRVEVLDRGAVIAGCSVLVGQLRVTPPTSIRLTLPQPDPAGRPRTDATLCLRRVVPRFRRKVLYLVRAAQSRHVQAVQSKDPRLANAIDHPLSLEGVQEARELHRLWALPLDSDCRLEMMKVDLVMSSPLTRALQTAVVAFGGLPAVAKRNIFLLSLAREVQARGGHDTRGTKVGPALLKKAMTELREVVGEEAAHYNAVKIDSFDCFSQWWSESDKEEGEAETSLRLQQLRSLFHGLKFHTGLLVTHPVLASLFLRRFAAPELLSNPATAAMVHEDLPRAQCLRLELDLDAPSGPAIVSVSYPWARR